MYKLMKLAILILAVVSLAACFNSSKTRYRTAPATGDPVTAAERDKAIAERDAAIAERDAAITEFGDDFSSSSGNTLTLAAVTRTPRVTGQNIDLYHNFNPHQLAGGASNRAYNIGTGGRGMLNPDYLRIRTDAQLYPRDGDEDPRIFAKTGASVLEFPGRGTVFRTVSFASSHGAYPGARLTIQGAAPQASNWRNWEHPVVTSFQFMRDGDNPGMVMNFGAAEVKDGDGTVIRKTGAIFSDLETYAGKACCDTDRDYNAASSHDLTIAFGASQPNNPNQDLAYYWQSLVPNHHNGRLSPDSDSPGGVLVPGETVGSKAAHDPRTFTATNDVGTYTLELTHAATGLNAAADDDDRYLSYAAYGLFNFFDKYTDAANGGRLGRMQTISYGLDAFANADNRRTTDLTGSDNIVATFKGRTIAYLVQLTPGTANRRFVQTLTRMRGDVELTADIGNDSNTINGVISNLEYITSDRHWSQEGHGIVATGFNFATAFRASDATLTLSSGTINAAGGYTGVVTPTTAPATYFVNGAYQGNLYGPLDGLETAGTWYLPAKETPTNLGVGGIIGSFGACQDDKGRC